MENFEIIKADSIHFFENYRSLTKLMTLKRRALELCEPGSEEASTLRRDIVRIGAEMSKIRLAIENYTPADGRRSEDSLCDEQIFLYYRYIMRFTMEQTAELMNVSRDTVYRLRRKIAGNLARMKTDRTAAN